MSNENNTEVWELDGKEYALIKRLGWLEQDRIDDKAFRLTIDGKKLDSFGGDVKNIKELSVEMTTDRHNMARLCARVLVGPEQKPLRPNGAMKLSPIHARVLLARIEELEDEEKAEVEALKPGNPTERS